MCHCSIFLKDKWFALCSRISSFIGIQGSGCLCLFQCWSSGFGLHGRYIGHQSSGFMLYGRSFSHQSSGFALHGSYFGHQSLGFRLHGPYFGYHSSGFGLHGTYFEYLSSFLLAYKNTIFKGWAYCPMQIPSSVFRHTALCRYHVQCSALMPYVDTMLGVRAYCPAHIGNTLGFLYLLRIRANALFCI